MYIQTDEIGSYKDELKTLTLTHEWKQQGMTIIGLGSVMSQWLPFLPKNHKIVLAKENDTIIGWGVGNYYDDWGKKYNVCMVNIYVSPQHRGKGIGIEIGKQLFLLTKEQKYKRIIMNFSDPSAIKMYRKLSNFIGIKRQPFTPPSWWDSKEWKMIKINYE